MTSTHTASEPHARTPVSIAVRLPTALQTLTDGAAEVRAPGSTAGAVLEAVDVQHPGILSRILTPEGGIRPLVNVYLGDTNLRDLEGLETPVRDGDVLLVIPAVLGG